MEINATLLLQLVLFLVLLAWMSTVLVAPLLAIYDEREKRIDGAAHEAKQLRAGAEEKAGLVEAKLREAQDEARQVLDGLRKKGLEREKELIDEARKKAESRLADAEAELFAQSEEIKASLRPDAEKIAAEVVAKILGRAA